MQVARLQVDLDRAAARQEAQPVWSLHAPRVASGGHASLPVWCDTNFVLGVPSMFRVCAAQASLEVDVTLPDGAAFRVSLYYDHHTPIVAQGNMRNTRLNPIDLISQDLQQRCLQLQEQLHASERAANASQQLILDQAEELQQWQQHAEVRLLIKCPPPTAEL